MGTFTNRLNLEKPAGGSSGTIPGDDQADIDVLNDNADKIDAAIGVRYVTSTTRPATPYDGQLIKETDTTKLLVYRQATSTWEDAVPGMRGSTALRDLYFGTPVSASARVALANKVPLWFNTDNGYEEQYFCNDGDGGAIKKFFSAKTSGWYPMGGRKPYALVQKDIAQNTANGNITVTWSSSGIAEGTDASMYSTAQNTRIVAPVRGHYRVRVKFRTNGTAPVTVVLQRNGVDYDRTRSSDAGVVGSATSVFIDSLVFMDANQYLTLIVTSTAAVAVSTSAETWIELEYAMPEVVQS